MSGHVRLASLVATHSCQWHNKPLKTAARFEWVLIFISQQTVCNGSDYSSTRSTKRTLSGRLSCYCIAQITV